MSTVQSPFPVSRLICLPRINDVRYSHEGQLLKHVTIEGKGELRLLLDGSRWETISSALDVRGGIGYGGGDFSVGRESALFSARGEGLFQVSLRTPFKLRCAYPLKSASASACASANGNFALFIQSADDRESLGLVDLENQSSAVEILHGADFYMSPTWHPTGRWIAWVEWDHPHMPWDASRVRLGQLDTATARLTPLKWEAGGFGRSASQPRFSPDGKWLAYLIRSGDWDSLVIRELATGVEFILLRGAGTHLRLAEWVHGMRAFVWSPDSRMIVHFRYHRAETSMWKTEVSGGKSNEVNIQPVRWASQLDISPQDGELAFLGSAPAIPKQICRLSADEVFCEPSLLEGVQSAALERAAPIEYLTADGEKAYGLYYPPAGQIQTNAPLILHIHGGPTAVADLGFNHEAIFFTSRGFGYAEVNYRGSATFGYAYQDALREKWGVVDVQDTIALADRLVELGWAHPGRVALFGSSAGGFTVLNTLIAAPGRFRAGICAYAVTDLVADARTTHKFEKYYHRFLIGSLDQNLPRFIERSPINQAEKIMDPLLLFHGDQDPVVDIAQSRRIFQQLEQKGVACRLVVYEGEGHGFRKKENISDYYCRIEEFINQHFK